MRTRLHRPEAQARIVIELASLACEEQSPAATLASRNIIILNDLPPRSESSTFAYASAFRGFGIQVRGQGAGRGTRECRCIFVGFKFYILHFDFPRSTPESRLLSSSSLRIIPRNWLGRFSAGKCIMVPVPICIIRHVGSCIMGTRFARGWSVFRRPNAPPRGNVAPSPCGALARSSSSFPHHPTNLAWKVFGEKLRNGTSAHVQTRPMLVASAELPGGGYPPPLHGSRSIRCHSATSNPPHSPRRCSM